MHPHLEYRKTKSHKNLYTGNGKNQYRGTSQDEKRLIRQVIFLIEINQGMEKDPDEVADLTIYYIYQPAKDEWDYQSINKKQVSSEDGVGEL